MALTFEITLLTIAAGFALATCHFDSSLDIHDVACNRSTSTCQCRETVDVCIFSLELKIFMTQTRYRTKNGAQQGTNYFFADNGTLLPHPSAPTQCAIPLDDDSCTQPFTVDSATYRPFIAVNWQIPGPTLVVKYNQTIVVDVVNHLGQETLSIHWHGLHQTSTPFMDGVERVTQSGISPGASFRYIFKAIPSGTFWYHSHTGTQRSDGAYGALVIMETNTQDIKLHLKPDLANFDDYPAQHTISILDWFPQRVENFAPSALGATLFYPLDNHIPVPREQQYYGEVAPDGVENGSFFFWSAIINGKGKHTDSKYPYIKSRLSVFSVNPGRVYRFRIIGAQAFFMFMFSIDEHDLEVFATDGYIIQPVKADYIIMHSGERFDILLKTKPNPTKENFWIRVQLLAIETGRKYPKGPVNGSAPFPIYKGGAEAILHYNTEGSSIPTSDQYESIKHNSTEKNCSADNPCHAVNCPFVFHPSYNITCTFTDEFRLLLPTPKEELPLKDPNADGGKEIFFNFGVDGLGPHMAVNGRRMRLPSVAPQLLIRDPEELHRLHQKEFCKNIHDVNICRKVARRVSSPDCHCTQVFSLPAFGKTTRFILSNIGPRAMTAHPIHLHGHSFFVHKVGFPTYNHSTGFRFCETADLDCFVAPGLGRCSYGRWTYFADSCIPKWSKGHRPTFADPSAKIDPYTTRKDTLTIPAGGYAMIQFLSNNPGYWFMHCHVATHQTEGMAVIINEAPDNQKPGPIAMPISGSFTWTLKDFYQATSNTTRVPITSNPQHKPPVPIRNANSDIHTHKLQATSAHNADRNERTQKMAMVTSVQSNVVLSKENALLCYTTQR